MQHDAPLVYCSRLQSESGSAPAVSVNATATINWPMSIEVKGFTRGLADVPYFAGLTIFFFDERGLDNPMHRVLRIMHDRE